MTEALTRLGLNTSANIRPSDEADILGAFYANAKCDSCTKTPQEATDCYKTFAKLDEYGAVVISCGYCPKAKAFLMQRKIDRLTKASGMGKRFAQRKFDTFRPVAGTEDALKICRNFCMTFQPDAKGIRLIGAYGCGKTHLAAAVLNEVMGRGVAGMFIVVPDFLSQLRAAFDNKSLAPAVNELAELARSVPLLILDDLGAEKASDWVKEQLFLLVNARYEKELPTIVTTNLSTDNLNRQIGERIVSRLNEMTTAVHINAGDYRKGNKEAPPPNIWGSDAAAPPM